MIEWILFGVGLACDSIAVFSTLENVKLYGADLVEANPLMRKAIKKSPLVAIALHASMWVWSAILLVLCTMSSGELIGIAFMAFVCVVCGWDCAHDLWIDYIDWRDSKR
jgi:hypothetical protein